MAGTCSRRSAPPIDFDPQTIAEAYEWSGPMLGRIPRAAIRSVLRRSPPRDATPLDRLAALLGREVR